MDHTGAGGHPSVSDFYAGRSVFVTGATGFLGKVLLEKLLWSCPGVKLVYVLLRPKRKQDVHTRLLDLLRLPLFDRLRESRPEDLEKIVPVMGDVGQLKLGLNPFDEGLLLSEVSVVFHSAATVRFNEELQLATQINLVGTKAVAELCRRMHKLQAFVHVSTAYCNTHQNDVREEVYPPPYDPEKAIRMVDAMDDDLRKRLSPQILSYVRQSNTYTFTKAMTESLLVSNYSDLPFDIVRPSAVSASLKEPIPGWVDSNSGAPLIFALVDKGYMRVLPAHANHVLDLIPVDMVANCILCTAWRRAIYPPNATPVVYNISSGRRNPLSYRDVVIATSFSFLRKYSLQCLIYPEIFLQPNWIMYQVFASVLETLPAYAFDSWTSILGGKPHNVNIDNRKKELIATYRYYFSQEWNFIDENVSSLSNLLNIEDQKQFIFDVEEIQWYTYLENVVFGLRRFVFKTGNKIQKEHKNMKQRKMQPNSDEDCHIVRNPKKLYSNL